MAGALSFAPESVAVLAHAAKPAVNTKIRKILGNKIGKHVRIIPELLFLVDDLEEKATRMDALIDSLDIPPEKEDDESEQEK